MPLVELYLASSFEDLEKFVTVPEIKNAKLMCNSAVKLYAEAERCYVVGDHERSYVLFGKYFKTILPLKTRDDYRRHKAELDGILGPQSKQLRAIEMMSEVRNNLVARYEAAKTKSSTVIIPAAAMDTVRIKDEDVPLAAPLTKSCSDLRQAIQRNENILLLDCRTGEDFERSRLKVDYMLLHVPEDKIQLGMTASKVGGIFQLDSDRLRWASRATRKEIVLMDWSTQGPEAVRGSSLWILKDIMLNWDPEIEYKSILVLEGGYERYILMYPMDCTNPNVVPPTALLAADSLLAQDGQLDDIEYPSLSDITMKEQSFGGGSFYGPQPVAVGSRPGPPTVDRSSKLAALKTYHSRQEMLREQHEIADKLLASQRECLIEERELAKRITVDATDPEVEDDAEEKINETRFKIMQLDNSIEDAMLKRQEVEETRVPVATSERDTEEEQSENLRIAASIRQKEEEIRRIQGERERHAREREEKLRLAKEQKKYLQNKNAANQSQQPTAAVHVPVIDRSVKPPAATATYALDDNVQRDFAPVYGSVGRGLTGLKNLGNTCYMNSILQCLSNTSPLVEYFVTDIYRKHLNVANKTQGRVANEVAALIRELWTGQYRSIASKDLRYVVGQYEKTFRSMDQQDSHEFLTILVDLMHSDLQTLQSTVFVPPGSPKMSLLPADRSWLEHTKNRESNIFRLFYGQIKSTVKCKVCLKESATYDCFSNLSLELPPDRSGRCSVYSCFDMYFHGEAIEAWDCPSCAQKRDAVKKLDISKLPPVLVVHFKRFYADPHTNSYRKKTSFIDFPLNGLDIGEYVARSEKKRNANLQRSTVYNLYAISNHYGSMESGHYTAYCRNNLLGDWYKYDDQTVSRLDKADVVSSGAYILFYTNLADAPLPLFKN